MESTLVLALVAFVGLCSAAPRNVSPDGDSVIVNYDIDAHARLESGAERIVGGTATTVGVYPWVVQMEFFSGVWNQACAANILNSVYVLSAAQCTHTHTDLFYRIENRRIRAGSSKRNTGGVVSTLFSVLNHPSYNPMKSDDADISLIRLIQALTLGTNIQSVSIAPQNHILPDHVPVIQVGWGATSTGGSYSNVLLQVTVNSMDLTLCRQRYAFANPPRNISTNMICSGIQNIGGRDACHGDAGGPLYYGRTLVGVISSGLYCADSFFPGVNTRVAAYTTWIANNVI